MRFEAVADELYGAARDEFIDLRNERAAEAKAAGQEKLAKKIRGLRKPTTAAWLANQLARERGEHIGRLGQLGDALRKAHTELDGEDLRALSRQRHELIEALTDEARTVGNDLGVPVSDAVSEEVAETLAAALADPDAARTLAEGRLTTALHAAASSPERWLSAATATAPRKPNRSRAAAPRTARGTRSSSEKAREAAAKNKEDRQREREAQRAEEARRRIARVHAKAAVRDAKKARTEAGKRLREAEQAEARARRAADAARAEAEQADRALAEAERKLADLG